MAEVDWEPLVGAALEVRGRAYAPYSRYRVGAALLGHNGSIYVGCNVENASYPVCLCAEHSAIASAVSAGCREFDALVVATGGDVPGPPCGVCRQALREFAPEIPILLVTTARTSQQLALPDLFGDPPSQREALSLDELLPHSFGPSMLGDEPDDTA